MKLIAHRGLVGGPNKSLENRPDVVLDTLSAGFDCEVDLWIVDDRLYLGHDRPQHNVTVDFIATSGLWIHAKSLATLAWLAKIPYALNYFWHQTDDYTITSQRYIWVYPGKPLTDKCIMVMPEWEDATLNNVKDVKCYGVCSDFVQLIQQDFNKYQKEVL